MSKFGTALLGATALVASGAAIAAEPQWDYVQIGWIQGDGFDDYGKTQGFELKASISFLENFHAQLSYADGDIKDDFDFDNPDFDGYDLTLGYHLPVTASGNTHFVADVNYFDYDFKTDGFSADNKGYGLGVGVRSVLGDKVELEGKLTYTRGEFDIYGGDDDYTDTSVKVGVRYLWTENLSTGLTVTVNDTKAAYYFGGESAVIDLRYGFGSLFR